MEDKFIWVARILIIAGLAYVVYNLFFSNNSLGNAIRDIDKAKIEIDSARMAIREVQHNLKSLDATAIQTQKRLDKLRFERDSLARVFTGMISKDRITLKKYEKMLEHSMAQRDSLTKWINKFERVYANR